ncbi:unnamed protein product [Anisakis simplex]|uniref:DUF4801 domain-containing protein n=1 Tax=Anisakis simplex TaxID=6269 RepID=A0A0M3JC06_ANISI|nr:unnamed protein product [Anisakis simplex]
MGANWILLLLCASLVFFVYLLIRSTDFIRCVLRRFGWTRLEEHEETCSNTHEEADEQTTLRNGTNLNDGVAKKHSFGSYQHENGEDDQPMSQTQVHDQQRNSVPSSSSAYQLSPGKCSPASMGTLDTPAGATDIVVDTYQFMNTPNASVHPSLSDDRERDDDAVPTMYGGDRHQMEAISPKRTDSDVRLRPISPYDNASKSALSSEEEDMGELNNCFEAINLTREHRQNFSVDFCSSQLFYYEHKQRQARITPKKDVEACFMQHREMKGFEFSRKIAKVQVYYRY